MEAPPVVRPKRRPIPIWGWVVGAILLGLAIAGLVGGRPSHLVRVNHADPELQAAIRQAQAELPKFVTRLQRPQTGDRFFVRGAFPSPQGNEYLWVRGVTGSGEGFSGVLDEPPAVYAKAKRGDTVTLAKADVVDWVIKNGDQLEGGYTRRLLTR